MALGSKSKAHFASLASQGSPSRSGSNPTAGDSLASTPRHIPEHTGQRFTIPPPPQGLWLEAPCLVNDPEDHTWEDDLIRDSRFRPRIFVANAETTLEKCPIFAGSLAWDEFDGRIRLTRPFLGSGWPGASFGEDHLMAFRVWCEIHLNVSFRIKLLEDAVTAVAKRNRRHVVRDFQNRLIWDGQERLAQLAHYYFKAEDTPYNRAVMKKFLISAVARIQNPGCKVDTTPVFEGPQGTFKSTSLQVLFLNPQWVNDTPLDLRSKDAHIALQGKWVIEFAELDALSKADSARVKAFLTLSSDTFRGLYKEGTHQFPRTCVFVGTCNESAYLNDSTGGRRFWPIVVGDIDLVALARDREQLWAEAVHLFKAGEPWHLSYEEEQLAREEQDRRRIEHPWEAPIASFLSGCQDTTISEVITKALDLKQFRANSSEGRQIAQILSGVFGWRRTKVIRGNTRVNGYVRPVIHVQDGSNGAEE